jgi:cyclic dehypoxanthinyl futalosine synthase
VIGDLNARPLWKSLEGDPAILLRKRSPASAAGLLEAEAVDLGLVPVALAAERGWYRVPGLGIAARGAVGSVLVLADAPVEEARVIYADDASRTSVLLLRVLLAEAGRTTPVIPLPSSEARARARSEPGAAALLIGDRALAARGAFAHAWDLARAWHERTALPFVFGVWASRGPVTSSVIAALERAARTPYDPADALGEGLDDAAARAYLAGLHHVLDAEDEAGLALFLSLAKKHGLLPADASLRAAPVRRARPARRRDPDSILARATAGERLDGDEALLLHESAPLADLCTAADARRAALDPSGVVTYIIDRNINYTNVCVTRCDFCAFYRLPGDKEGYVLTDDELAKKVEETRALGGRQILLQGGVNPELKIEWYERLLRFLRGRFPDVNVHGFSPEEIAFIARVSAITIDETLDRLVAAGLGSLPGGGAEVLVDEVRARIAPLKVSTDGWLSVMAKAQRRGLTTTATMMFGSGDVPRERVEHLLRVRALQDETRSSGGTGFTSFIPWTFQEKNTPLEAVDAGPCAYLRLLALSRLVLDNVPHLQASWVTQGAGVAQAALRAGADDMGSIMIEENVVAAAGARFRMDALELERQVRACGFKPALRNVHYDVLELR